MIKEHFSHSVCALIFLQGALMTSCAPLSAPAPTPIPATKTISPTLTTQPTTSATKILPPATVAPTTPTLPAAAAGSSPASLAVPVASESAPCLVCHGPFDRLIEITKSYMAPSYERTSPHRFIPHDQPAAENIPDCTHCHSEHALSPLPASGTIDVTKVEISWCYAACHHKANFTPCRSCHR
jgi:hypothetical protein